MATTRIPMDWSEYFDHDPAAGTLAWKWRPRSHFVDERAYLSWNNKWPGREAGKRANRFGYNKKACIVIMIGPKAYLTHRIIWEIYNGAIPAGMVIDHINGDPWDNRLSNLRLATQSQNLANSERPITNTTGFKGVSLDRRSGKFTAHIKSNRKTTYLGLFATAKEAHAAYCKKSIEINGEFARFK
jgi:hypothetical protein